MNKENCGCSIAVLGDPTLSLDQFLEAGGQFKFNYCQTHAAAFEMREALKKVATWVAYPQTTIRAEEFTVVFAALSLAEGKEADNDKP